MKKFKEKWSTHFCLFVALVEAILCYISFRQGSYALSTMDLLFTYYFLGMWMMNRIRDEQLEDAEQKKEEALEQKRRTGIDPATVKTPYQKLEYDSKLSKMGLLDKLIDEVSKEGVIGIPERYLESNAKLTDEQIEDLMRNRR